MQDNYKPIISVIVPIYNVEKYVRKCLDSLFNQTMKEIEIICIDDGSTDQSGKIADEYASDSWPIFRVIHTENRGLSAARNRGIDEAKAEWLMFVDSDDWVDPDFCRKPYEVANKYSAQLVIFGAVASKRGKLEDKRKNIPTGIINEFTAQEFGRVNAWNKMYLRILFDSIRYPEGKVYEDCATTHRLVHKATRIVYLQEYLYHHLVRSNSITTIHSIQNQRDSFEAVINRTNDLVTWGLFDGKQDSLLCGAAIGYLSVASQYEDELYNKAAKIIDEQKEVPEYLTNKQKIAFITWKTDKKLFNVISNIRRWRNKRKESLTGGTSNGRLDACKARKGTGNKPTNYNPKHHY